MDSFPVTFKFGDATPVYYIFETLDELSEFYTSAITYLCQQRVGRELGEERRSRLERV